MRDAIAQCDESRALLARCGNRTSRMSVMRRLEACKAQGSYSGRPTLRLAYDKIPERLDACHRLQLLGINEIRVELNRIGFAEELHQPICIFDQVVR